MCEFESQETFTLSLEGVGLQDNSNQALFAHLTTPIQLWFVETWPFSEPMWPSTAAGIVVQMNTTHVLNTRRAAPFQRDEPDELTKTVSARVPQGIKYCDTRRSIVVPGILRNDNQPFHHFPR